MVTRVANHEAQARERFDEWSVSWTFRRLRPWLVFAQCRVLERIDWSQTTRVLDVACGSGWAVYQAARRLPEGGQALACGCDLSLGMLQQRVNGQSGPQNAYFLEASAQSLPYKSGIFDAIFCTAAFHHFPAPATALREFRRVLRPGGQALIVDPCRDQSIATWVWDRLHRWFERGHVKYYRRDELLTLLRDAQFDRVQLTELNPSYAESKKLFHKAALFSAIKPK